MAGENRRENPGNQTQAGRAAVKPAPINKRGIEMNNKKRKELEKFLSETATYIERNYNIQIWFTQVTGIDMESEEQIYLLTISADLKEENHVNS